MLYLTGLSQGSSPLARGTLKLFGFFLTYRGLIPARAGNTVNCEYRNSI